jgi:hypothetical protein
VSRKRSSSSCLNLELVVVLVLEEVENSAQWNLVRIASAPGLNGYR